MHTYGSNIILYSGFHLIGLLLIRLPGCCYLVTTCLQGCEIHCIIDVVLKLYCMYCLGDRHNAIDTGKGMHQTITCCYLVTTCLQGCEIHCIIDVVLKLYCMYCLGDRHNAIDTGKGMHQTITSSHIHIYTSGGFNFA